MNLQWVSGFILMGCAVSSMADSESPQSINAQQKDQKQCVQELVGKCVAQCDKTLDKNCVSLCSENIKNQCLYAGE